MDAVMVVAAAVLALVAGVIIGWVLAGRSAAPVKAAAEASKAEAETLRQQLGTAERELAVALEQARPLPQTEAMLRAVTEEREAALQQVARMSPIVERAERLETELVTLRVEKEQLSAAKAAYERGEQERRQAYEEQLAQLKDLEVRLEARFGQLAGQAVESAHESFLKRAQEKLGASGKESAAKLETLLQPMRDTLSRYEADLRKLEQDRVGAYDGLRAQMSVLREGQERVATEALRLRTALRSSTGDVGRWGEEQCRNVLERAGLQEGIDFEEQVATDTVGDRTKPDFVVRLPGDRQVIIDVKCSLDSYIGASEAQDDGLRDKLLGEHARAIRSHALSLIKRTYQDKFKKSANFVVMFVPGENFLHAAIKLDNSLLADAQKGNVIIVGPTNLLSIILNVAAMRDQAKLAQRAEQIGEIGKRLYENLATLGKNAHAMSGSVRSLLSNWNSLVGSLDGHWLSTARKFDELGVGKGSESVRPLESLELSVREPQRLLTSAPATSSGESKQIAAE